MRVGGRSAGSVSSLRVSSVRPERGNHRGVQRERDPVEEREAFDHQLHPALVRAVDRGLEAHLPEELVLEHLCEHIFNGRIFLFRCREPLLQQCNSLGHDIELAYNAIENVVNFIYWRSF